MSNSKRDRRDEVRLQAGEHDAEAEAYFADARTSEARYEAALREPTDASRSERAWARYRAGRVGREVYEDACREEYQEGVASIESAREAWSRDLSRARAHETEARQRRLWLGDD